MIKTLLNKMRGPEDNKAQPINPRARMQARVDVLRDAAEDTERRVLAGLAPAKDLDSARSALATAYCTLDAFDAARHQESADVARREERGAALLKEAQAADARIDAAARELEAALVAAEPVIEEIERSFRVHGGYAEPFRESPVVERLRFWGDGFAIFAAGQWQVVGQFAERLAAYRRLVEPPREAQKPIAPRKESAATKAKRQRLALQNSRMRSAAAPDGQGVMVVNETRFA